jgi:hypothetical protein
MNRTKNVLAVGLAGTALALAGAVATPAYAASNAQAAGTVDCSGWVNPDDTDEGIAGCTNNTDRSVTFRVELVCGLAPDASGDWVTIAPGQYSQSSAVCAIYSSGIGSVGWTIQ